MRNEEKILKPFEKKCLKCRKVGLVPSRSGICIECIRKELRLENWEYVCLQCGEKKGYRIDKHKICLECLDKNESHSLEKLKDVLHYKQRVLLEEYMMWSDTRASFIILMS